MEDQSKQQERERAPGSNSSSSSTRREKGFSLEMEAKSVSPGHNDTGEPWLSILRWRQEVAGVPPLSTDQGMTSSEH